MTKTYDTLRTECPNLCPYPQLLSAFAVDHLESYTLSALAGCILETLQTSKELFHTVLEPEVGVTELYEQAFFTQPDRENLFLLFKKIAYLERTMRLAQLSTPHDASNLITEVVNAWPEVRKECEAFARRLRDTWLVEEKPEKVRTFLEYLV